MEPAPTVLHGLNRDPNHTDIRLRKAAKDLETSFLAEMLKSAKILKMPDGFGIAPCKWSTNWDSFVPQIGGSAMAGKREKPEEIVSKLRQVEVLQGQGMTVAEAVRQIGVTQQTFYRWRKLYGGMGRSQLKRLKELEKENQRLRRAVSDLTLDKLILTEASRGNF